MSEKITIVNDKDKIIAYKKRTLMQINDIFRVSALWIINSSGQILLAKRSLNKKNDPGKWGPAVSGTIEKNESYLDNIIKETKEEIGIDLGQYSFKEIEKIHTNKEHKFFCQWYLLKEDIDISDLDVQIDEVEKLKWIDKLEFTNDLRQHPAKYTVDMLKHFKILQKY